MEEKVACLVMWKCKKKRGEGEDWQRITAFQSPTYVCMMHPTNAMQMSIIKYWKYMDPCNYNNSYGCFIPVGHDLFCKIRSSSKLFFPPCPILVSAYKGEPFNA
eukprot:m.60247 g.60247  ORF g.60247 m.60247 type:complete len:104 (+) comp7933_c0_seq7:375-686(+)